jgi:hypothetical protein
MHRTLGIDRGRRLSLFVVDGGGDMEFEGCGGGVCETHHNGIDFYKLIAAIQWLCQFYNLFI